jgi:3D (Asp-Asp-Asp) domain-containing protein
MKIPSKVLMIVSICILTYFSAYGSWYADAINQEEVYVLTSESLTKSVVKVQTLLKKVWAYEWAIDGKYQSIKDTILELQTEFSIITNEDDAKAWKVDNEFLQKIQTKYASAFQREKYDRVINESEEKKKDEYIENELKKSVDTKFVVTAYYSPLPGQKKYSTWSYSWDIRLNGRGTHGASWAAVHEWFLAAPKNYPFGTKIYLDGIGVWIVEDRGWAIVNAGSRGYSYDRIDVWMWYGDAGLTRALNWWKKTVDGKILWEDAELIVNFQTSAAAEYYNLTVNPNSSKASVKQLQELLKKIWYYDWKIDGKYTNVENPLVEYQKESWIITDKDSWWAGYFWEKTFLAIQKDLHWELKKAVEWNVLADEKVVAITREKISDEDQIIEVLTNAEKWELRTLSKNLERALSKKSDGNRITIGNYNNKIKVRLEKMIGITNNQKTKEKLKFLLNTIK